MEGINPLSSAVHGSEGSQVNPKLLKKSHDMMEQQALALLKALPPPPSAPGMGGHVDVKV